MLNDMFQYLFNEDLSKLSIGATIKFLGTFTTGYHYIAITNKWYSKWYLPSPSDFMFCWRICNYCAEKRLRIAEINNILLQVLLAGNISFWFNCFIIFLWDLEDGDVAGSLSDFDKRYVLLNFFHGRNRIFYLLNNYVSLLITAYIENQAKDSILPKLFTSISPSFCTHDISEVTKLPICIFYAGFKCVSILI